MFHLISSLINERPDLINKVALPFAWITSIVGVATSDVTMYLSWVSMSSAAFASIVVAYVNLRKPKK